MEQILKNAIKKQGTKGNISHDDLVATAKELGIDEHDLQSAIEDFLEGISPLEEAKLEWRKQKKRKFYDHLRTYLIMNALFTGICYYSGDNWFVWPLMGWGVGIVFDAFSAFMPNESGIILVPIPADTGSEPKVTPTPKTGAANTAVPPSPTVGATPKPLATPPPRADKPTTKKPATAKPAKPSDED